MYEVIPEHPFLMPLSSWLASTGHQALSLQSKNLCDIRSVEFQRGWRLTEKSVEFLSFRVPRVKVCVSLFSSDSTLWHFFFVERRLSKRYFSRLTRHMAIDTDGRSMVWRRSTRCHLSQSPSRWHGRWFVFDSFALSIKNVSAMATAPMMSLTAAANRPPPKSKPIVDDDLKMTDDDDRRKELQASWSQQIGVDHRLEQDAMEGVDESEWNYNS